MDDTLYHRILILLVIYFNNMCICMIGCLNHDNVYCFCKPQKGIQETVAIDELIQWVIGSKNCMDIQNLIYLLLFRILLFLWLVQWVRILCIYRNILWECTTFSMLQEHILLLSFLQAYIQSLYALLDGIRLYFHLIFFVLYIEGGLILLFIMIKNV